MEALVVAMDRTERRRDGEETRWQGSGLVTDY